MKTEERSRHTVWMEDTVWQRVQEHYKSDGCSTQNEFIAKAILFYCGYLQSEYAGDFLPKILGETLEAILSMFGDRIGKLLLKQAVEQNICNHILASDTDIDAATYQKMRGMSYQEVLRTNGQISFPEVLRQQNRLCVYREKQLAGLKTCKLLSKKSTLYCTRDSARISRTIICRNNIDTDPPYWVLLVLRRVEGRFR